MGPQGQPVVAAAPVTCIAAFRVKHLILVDPWGFPLRPADPSQVRAPPTWVKAVASVLGRSNPLAVLRVAGPWGE